MNMSVSFFKALSFTPGSAGGGGPQCCFSCATSLAPSPSVT